MSVIKWDAERDGVLNENTLRQKLSQQGYFVHTYRYPAGTRFPDHTHDVDKIDGVVSGQFLITIHGQEFLLQAGDCIEIPRGVRHAAAVVGNEPVVSVDAIKR